MSSPLVIIHGWTYSIEPWSKTVALLQDAGVTVIQLRVPGLTSESSKVWTIDDYVAWLHEELQGIDSPIVLGHSNGGRIAMHYLVAHPGRFQKLILLSSAGIEVNSLQLSRKRRLFRTASKILAPLKRVPGARRVLHKLLGSDYGRAPEHMQKTLANMLASDRTFSPDSIETPTVILWGEADTTTPLAMGEQLARRLPHSTLHTYPDWKHAPYITHPEELSAAILQALEEKP